VPKILKKERRSSSSVALSVTPWRRRASTRQGQTCTDSSAGKLGKHRGPSTVYTDANKDKGDAFLNAFFFIHLLIVFFEIKLFIHLLLFLKTSIESRKSILKSALFFQGSFGARTLCSNTWRTRKSIFPEQKWFLPD
jgi:hypothetical protein